MQVKSITDSAVYERPAGFSVCSWQGIPGSGTGAKLSFLQAEKRVLPISKDISNLLKVNSPLSKWIDKIETRF